jgi:hypothetical protein
MFWPATESGSINSAPAADTVASAITKAANAA